MIFAAIPYMPEVIQQWDVNVLNAIHNALYDNAFCRFFFPAVTLLGEKGIVCIATAVILLVIGIIGNVSKKTPIEKKAAYVKLIKMAVTMGLALALGLALGNGLIKGICLRLRPYQIAGSLIMEKDALGPLQTDTSFPSGHTLAVFETAVALWYYDKRAGIPAAVVAVLVAFSRLFLYFHFPTDVIAGAILGSIFAVISIVIVNLVCKFIEKQKAKKENKTLE